MNKEEWYEISTIWGEAHKQKICATEIALGIEKIYIFPLLPVLLLLFKETEYEKNESKQSKFLQFSCLVCETEPEKGSVKLTRRSKNQLT